MDTVPGPASAPGELPCRPPSRAAPTSGINEPGTLWATHALFPFPTYRYGQVILVPVPRGRQFSPSPRNTRGGGTPSTQRLRAFHGGAGVHGGWRTSVPALCVVSPDEQSPLNPRGSGSVSPGKLRLRCVKDREGLPSSRAQSPF